MKVEAIVIPTAVARAGWTVRDVILECVAAGVRAIPYCDAQNRVTGLCSLKNIAKRTLIPAFMVEAANILGDDFQVLEDARAYARFWTSPSSPFCTNPFGL